MESSSLALLPHRASTPQPTRYFNNGDFRSRERHTHTQRDFMCWVTPQCPDGLASQGSGTQVQVSYRDQTAGSVAAAPRVGSRKRGSEPEPGPKPRHPRVGRGAGQYLCTQTPSPCSPGGSTVKHRRRTKGFVQLSLPAINENIAVGHWASARGTCRAAQACAALRGSPSPCGPREGTEGQAACTDPGTLGSL